MVSLLYLFKVVRGFRGTQGNESRWDGGSQGPLVLRQKTKISNGKGLIEYLHYIYRKTQTEKSEAYYLDSK